MEDPSEYVELDREAVWNLGTLTCVQELVWSSWRYYFVLCSVAPRCILCTDGASWYLMAPHGNMLHVPWTPRPVCSWPQASSHTFEAIVLLDQKLASKRLVGEPEFAKLDRGSHCWCHITEVLITNNDWEYTRRYGQLAEEIWQRLENQKAIQYCAILR